MPPPTVNVYLHAPNQSDLQRGAGMNSARRNPFKGQEETP